MPLSWLAPPVLLARPNQLGALREFCDDQVPLKHGDEDGASVSETGDAPVELIALDQPYDGCISARRAGEPSFTHVNGIGDAIMSVFSRGVDLVIPQDLFDEIRDNFPPELPSYIKVR